MSKPRSRGKPRRCFPRNHQTPGESALYNYAFAASRKSGIFYSDDRSDAKEFVSPRDPTKHVSKNTMTKWRHSLEHEGWFERLGPQERNPVTGMYFALRYNVLTNEEWHAKYPHRCNAWVGEVQPQEPAPVKDSNAHLSHSQGPVPVPIRSQLTDTTGPNKREPPVPATGTKSEVIGSMEEVRSHTETAIQNPNPSSSHDDDMTETVASRFVLEYEAPEDVIRLISDGCFRVSALKSYEHVDALVDSCREAVRAMGEEKFKGKATCANLMGKAMELLKGIGIKAPGGWYPAMKKLRAEGGPAKPFEDILMGGDYHEAEQTF